MLNSIVLLPFTLGMTAWLMIMPYFVWTNKIVLVLSSSILILTFLYLKILKKIVLYKKDFCFTLFWIVASLFLLQPCLNNGASIYGYTLITVVVAVLFLLPDSLKIRSFDWFRILFILSLLPGMLLWLVHAAGVSIDPFIVGEITGNDMLNSAKAQNNMFYYEFPGSVVLNYMLVYPAFRLSAMYDEPGVVGTLSAFFIVADNMNFRKWQNIILFIGGAMSFSFAFAVIIFLSILTRPKSISQIVVLLVGFYCVVYTFAPDTIPSIVNQFHGRIISRVAITDQGIAGDSRIGSTLDGNFQRWLSSDYSEILFGVNQNLEPDGSSNWKIIPVTRGVVGLLALLLVLLLIVIRYYAGLSTLVFAGVFCLSIYQRPMVWTLPFLMLFVGGSINLKQEMLRKCFHESHFNQPSVSG